MKPQEILRLVDYLHRDKDIDKEIIFESIETALLTAARKKYGIERELTVVIDRETGDVTATDEYGDELDLTEFGRIAAQTAKQVIIQRLREEERNVIYDDFEKRKDDIVVGTILRYEGPNLIVNLGKTEGYLPKKEQVREERYQVGDRIRAYVKEVKKVGSKVRIILTRTHPDFIRRLFELEVPEIGQEVITINEIVREPGYRTKLAVSSSNPRVDCVGACVGVRGTRIKNIIDELSGEKIDIIRWDENPEQLIKNALKPAEVYEVHLNDESHRAIALVPNNQLSLAIGKRGLNVRLASRLAGWEIDIENELQRRERQGEAITQLMSLPHLTQSMAEELFFNGYESLDDLLVLGEEQLSRLDGMDIERATEVIGMIDALLTEVREQAAAEEAQDSGDEHKALEGDEGAVEGGEAPAGDAQDAGEGEVEVKKDAAPGPEPEAVAESAEPAPEETESTAK